MITEAISRKRVDVIIHNAHCYDSNNLVLNNKFTKLRPLIEVPNEKFIAIAPMEEANSIVESMEDMVRNNSLKIYHIDGSTNYGLEH